MPNILDIDVVETDENSLPFFCERYRAMLSVGLINTEPELADHLKQTLDLCKQFLGGTIKDINQFRDVNRKARQYAMAVCAAGAVHKFQERLLSGSAIEIVEFTYPYELTNFIKNHIDEDTGLVTGFSPLKLSTVRHQLDSYPNAVGTSFISPSIG